MPERNIEPLDRDLVYPEKDFERSVRIKENMLKAIQEGGEEGDKKFRQALEELVEMRGRKLALIESAYISLRAGDSARAMQALTSASSEFPNDPEVAQATADVQKQLP